MYAALIAALLTPSLAPPGPPAAVETLSAETIAAFLPPTAWGAAYADLDQWTDARFAAAETLGAGGRSAAALRGLRGPLRDAGVRYVLLPLDPLKLNRGPRPAALVLDEGADAAAALAAVEGLEDPVAELLFARPLRAETRNGVAAILSGDWSDGAEPADANARDGLREAVSTGMAPVGMLLAPTAVQRNGLAELLPPDGPIAPRTAAALRWATLSFDPTADPAVRFRLRTDSPEAAADWAAAPARAARAFGAALPPAVTLTARGDRVVADLTTAELRSLVGAAAGSDLSVAAARKESVNRLKQIGLAMHNFHSTYQSFPPTASYADDGTPLLSWRVHLLKYLDGGDLYGRFHLDEPWDSPHNKALLTEMPDVFRSPRVETEPGLTYFQVAFGPGLPFEGRTGKSLADFKDGTVNTLLATEAAEAVPWTKPADWSPNLSDESADPRPGLLHGPDGTVLILMADGSVHTFDDAALTAENLRKLLTLQGRDVIDWEARP